MGVLFNDKVSSGLNIKPNGIYVDCTLGGGGHSKGILDNLKEGCLIGIDQDKEALAHTSKAAEEFSNVACP